MVSLAGRELAIIGRELAIIAGLTAFPFVVGYIGEQILYRWRQAARARSVWPTPSRSISARAKGSASSMRDRR